ncbi:hypothetical protein H0A66_16905 [Alcaligenaceae bacterium]|nr:hypothetical protein [Alcaligenaceae bacterium]
MSQEANKIKIAVTQGKQRFFALHPELLLEVDAISEQDAVAAGSGLDELRELAKYRAISGFAKRAGKDSLLMLMELGSDSKEEFDQLVAAQNIHIKKSIGM